MRSRITLLTAKSCYRNWYVSTQKIYCDQSRLERTILSAAPPQRFDTGKSMSIAPPLTRFTNRKSQISTRSFEKMIMKNATCSSQPLQRLSTLSCHVYYRTCEKFHSFRPKSVLHPSPGLSQFRINGLLRYLQVSGRRWALRLRDSCPDCFMHKLMHIHFSIKYYFMKYVFLPLFHTN